MRRLAALSLAVAASAWSPGASAQSSAPAPPPSTPRDAGWETASDVTAVAAMATQVIMPRIFFSDPETTVGWKARFHVSVLAPTLTLTALTLLNEYGLKSMIKTPRPGCPDVDVAKCPDPTNYQEMSSQSFAAFSALGQGVSIFLVDTTKWSGGKLNVGSAVGNVALPAIFAGVTAAGRVAGHWEDVAPVLLSSGVGLVVGLLTGLTYATLSRPECGYTGDLLCW